MNRSYHITNHAKERYTTRIYNFNSDKPLLLTMLESLDKSEDITSKIYDSVDMFFICMKNIKN